MKSVFPFHVLAVLLITTSFLLHSNPVEGQVLINEYSASNLNTFTDNYGEYEDWVELYNAGPASVSLGGYHLSDDTANVQKWAFPTGTSIASGSYLVIWTSGRDEASSGNFHTNFKLQQTKTNKEFIILSDASGNVLDSDSLDITKLGHSMGRIANGGINWGIFKQPTPGWSNASATSYITYANKSVVDSGSGFYSGNILVNISTTQPNSVIRYTLNGNSVTSSSPAFNLPINIAQTLVLKTRVFSNNPNILPGFENYKTFFINEVHSLPVVSISGTELDSLAAGQGWREPQGSFEYFNEAGERDAKGFGEFNRHGNDSWAYDQRGFDWITRDEMGYARYVKEKFFLGTNRSKFQRLILRPEGNDNYPASTGGAHMRDMYTHRLAERAGMFLDGRRSEKCVIYLNGEYWGVYSLREKVDDHDYTNYYYGQNKYNLQVIKTWGQTWAEYGGPSALADWDALHNFIVNNNMSIQSNWDYADSLLDVKSLTDYYLLNSYTVCADWLVWNTGWWRGLDTAGSHQKWGYLLWDNDNTFGHGVNYTGIPTQNSNADPCFQDSLTDPFSDPEGHSEMLNSLRAYQPFDQYYISRYADLLNTHFSCDSMIDVLDSIVSLVDPEMSRHCLKWGGNYNQWKANVDTLRNYILARCVSVPAGLGPCYNLTGPYPVHFNTDPPGAGSIKINSITINNFLWTGNYYQNLPIQLEAIESNSQYIFDHWEVFNHQVSPNDSLKAVQLSITQGDSVVAHFIDNPIAIDPPIVSHPDVKIKVFPNPFQDGTNVVIEGKVNATSLIVYDLLGKPVKRGISNGDNRFKVDRMGLANGIYWFRVMGNRDEVLGTGKLLIGRK